MRAAPHARSDTTSPPCHATAHTHTPARTGCLPRAGARQQGAVAAARHRRALHQELRRRGPLQHALGQRVDV
eukprot:2306453-Rhodomonas_salina.1